MTHVQKQYGNVGNIGDVIKHVSLISLLRSVLSTPGLVLYAETNAFIPSAPLEKANWQLKDARLPRADAVRRYEKIQLPYVRNNEYLCSPGIAREVLGNFGEVEAEFILCEKDPECQHLLRTSLPEARVLADHKDLSEILSLKECRYDAAVVLVDPCQFRHVQHLFAQWLQGIAKAVKPDRPVAVLVFDFSFQVPQWPDSESEALRLAGTFKKQQYCLALYANRAGYVAAQPPLEEIGWKFDRGIFDMEGSEAS